MKLELQKYKRDIYVETVSLFTARALLTILCVTVTIAAFIIIGTIFGELMWVIIPHNS